MQPFQVNILQTTLDDLQTRLQRVRWPDEVEGSGWDFGPNLAYLKGLLEYWQHQFGWRKK